MRNSILQEVLFPGLASIGIAMSDAVSAHYAICRSACTNRARGILVTSRTDIVLA